jgi:protein-tyrosine phosphatase
MQDGQVPPPAELEDLTKLISSWLDEDKIVRVACDLGLNRSGLVAARVLIERGMTAEDAIRQVRGVRRGALGSDPAGLFRKAGLAYASWLMNR